jgi:hypothetical protein
VTREYLRSLMEIIYSSGLERFRVPREQYDINKYYQLIAIDAGLKCGNQLFNFLSQVFDGLTFKLSLEFPSGYPYTAPSVKFTSSCFHPNVDTAGNICLDILKDKWSALLDVRTILISIQSLLGGKLRKNSQALTS